MSTKIHLFRLLDFASGSVLFAQQIFHKAKQDNKAKQKSDEEITFSFEQFSFSFLCFHVIIKESLLSSVKHQQNKFYCLFLFDTKRELRAKKEERGRLRVYNAPIQ
jgi:hypothetical protein